MELLVTCLPRCHWPHIPMTRRAMRDEHAYQFVRMKWLTASAPMTLAANHQG
jgi:hypothetical protein